MDSPVVLLVIGGFLAGLLCTARVLAWTASVRAARSGGAARAWLVPLVAHSGPWALALLAASTWAIASKGHPPWLAAWVGGLVTGPVFIAFLTVRATPRQARPAIPLTPERLAQKRHEFYLINAALLGLVGMVGGMSEQWSTPTPSVALIVVFTLAGVTGGSCFSWVMWQWYGTALQVGEKHRLRRAAERAHDA